MWPEASVYRCQVAADGGGTKRAPHARAWPVSLDTCSGCICGTSIKYKYGVSSVDYHLPAGTRTPITLSWLYPSRSAVQLK